VYAVSGQLVYTKRTTKMNKGWLELESDPGKLALSDIQFWILK